MAKLMDNANLGNKQEAAPMESMEQVIEKTVETFLDKKFDGYIDRIAKTLAKQHAEAEKKPKPTPGLTILGPMSRKNIYQEFAGPFIENTPDRQFRFAFNHPEALPLRKMYGWEPVKDAAGKEVLFGDQILVSMPKRRYEEEIVAKRESLIAHKRNARISTLEDEMDDIRKDTKGKGDVRMTGEYSVHYDDEPLAESIVQEGTR